MNRTRPFPFFFALFAIAFCFVFTGCFEEPAVSQPLLNSYDGPHAYVDVDASNFEEVVLNADKPVVVDFWAEWCGPCRKLAPSISYVSNEYDGKAIVAKLNVDEAQQISARYGVTAIPTLIFFENGEEVKRFNPGSISEITGQLDSMVN
ncbi:MAG: thioredoxin [Pirellulales bacterium]|nr:thioredoxin [Pirellulales bacterium]